jgi:hypothetical protein
VDHARADEPPKVRLDYVRAAGANGCPDEDVIRNEVSARLGRDPFDSRAERSVSAHISRNRQTLRARIHVKDSSGRLIGEREVVSEASDCSELAAATELAIAIAIDPLGAMKPRPPPPDDPPADPPASVTAARVEPTPDWVTERHEAPPPPPPAPRDPFRLHADGGALLAAGSAPDVAFGGRLLVGLRTAHVSLGAEGRFDMPARQPVGPGSVTSSMMLGTFVPCYHHRAIGGCALLGAGVVRASGESLPVSRDASGPIFVAGARLLVEIPLDQVLSVNLHGDLLAALSRISLQVNESEVWRTPPLSGALGVGFGMTFR